MHNLGKKPQRKRPVGRSRQTIGLWEVGYKNVKTGFI
jgi:hypothetical protein